MQGQWARNWDLEMWRAIFALLFWGHHWRQLYNLLFQQDTFECEMKVLRKIKLEQQFYTEPTRTQAHLQTRQVNFSGNFSFIIYKIESEKIICLVSSTLKHWVESQSSFLIPRFSATFKIGIHTFSDFSLLFHVYSMEISGHTKSSWRSISRKSVFLIVCL